MVSYHKRPVRNKYIAYVSKGTFREGSRWAAYVAGCVLVLMREKGVRFLDGVSILIASAVPEGKGVSSSAAVEVAVMQALLAAHCIPLSGHELATLCQKVSLSRLPVANYAVITCYI